ncbi:MAG: ferrous iron transport protein B [Myxococcales bacterium]|nr:ferrous iron transport protein B [Myxococcales bacterium]
MIEVALVGNPNTGKTTLFNRLTGAHAHVGNYPGVTVERRHGMRTSAQGGRWRVHDLPGCYSLVARSPEEELAWRALTGRGGQAPPDVAVVVLDATNLARNLLLFQQVVDTGLPVVAALNLMDVARLDGIAIDLSGLCAALGCAVVPLVAHSGEGLPELERAVEAAATAVAPTIAWPPAVKLALATARAELGPLAEGRPDGAVAWWLASDPAVVDRITPGLGARLERALPRAADPALDVRRQIATARFAHIDAIVARCVRTRSVNQASVSDRIDRVVLHPWLGMALFLGLMTLLFQGVFIGAAPAMAAVETAMAAVSSLVRTHLPASLARDVIVDGVLAGVAGTLMFVPQIVMLFFGVAVLEDSGYLARTAFLVDRVMQRIGLPGQAFVPLLSAHACAVPALLATRTMTNARDRLLTLLVVPLMSCSARLPVYTLVTAAVFADGAPLFGGFALGGFVVAGMYALGFVAALGSAFVLRRTVVRGGGAPLLLEMPPWRWPRARNVARVLVDRGWGFVSQTGSVIVALTVVLWVLMTFPRGGLDATERARLTQVATEAGPVGSVARAAAERALARRDAQVQLEQSFAGRIGKAVEPAIAPLGFDWRIGIGLVGSFAAREVLVPVMGQVYGRGSDADVDDTFAASVGQTLVQQGGLTPLKGLSLMVFFALALQCMSTVAALRRESGSWRWPALALVWLNGLAWVASFAVYQGGRLLGYG